MDGAAAQVDPAANAHVLIGKQANLSLIVFPWATFSLLLFAAGLGWTVQMC